MYLQRQKVILELLFLFFQTMKVYDFILYLFFLLARQTHMFSKTLIVSSRPYVPEKQYWILGQARFYRIVRQASGWGQCCKYGQSCWNEKWTMTQNRRMCSGEISQNSSFISSHQPWESWTKFHRLVKAHTGLKTAL